MDKYYYILDEIIKEELDAGNKIAIYPFGKIGMYAKAILEDRYGQKGIFIDNFFNRIYFFCICDLNRCEQFPLIVPTHNTGTNRQCHTQRQD